MPRTYPLRRGDNDFVVFCFASAKDAFFYNVADAQLTFERDATGHIAAVVLHQNGHPERAVRVETPQ